VNSAEPACWTWPIRPVTELATEALGGIMAGLSDFARELILEGHDEGLLAMESWQQ